MELKQLRLGNLVYYKVDKKNYLAEVTAISESVSIKFVDKPDSIESNDMEDLSPDLIEPILVDDNWKTLLGFQPNKNKIGQHYVKLGNYIVVYEKGLISILMQMENNKFYYLQKDMQYTVHEFQNTMFFFFKVDLRNLNRRERRGLKEKLKTIN